jgi:hypothetical protein
MGRFKWTHYRLAQNRNRPTTVCSVTWPEKQTLVNLLESRMQVSRLSCSGGLSKKEDVAQLVKIAHSVTSEAGGRIEVTSGSRTIKSGMDTFLWYGARPHKRPAQAFQYTPYTQEEWSAIFPDATRRLITERELASLTRKTNISGPYNDLAE